MNTANKGSAIPPLTEWSQVNWGKIDRYVRKLQQRIYRAETEGSARKVRGLQRLLIRSQAALLASIKRVTQENQGKRTAGVDGHKVLSPTKRVKLYNQMSGQTLAQHNPRPTKRTYIPKKNGKLRPLGIPTVKDRVWQNVAKLALEPQWEARFEPTSYGFRPKRSIHDAIEAIRNKITGRTNKKLWVFEGDFKGCFDNLNHDYIAEQIKNFPAVNLVKKWLKAGFVDNGVFNQTNTGTPQGGIISPLLANIALHGMETELGIRYNVRIKNVKGAKIHQVDTMSPHSAVRYADDFVILCETEEEASSMYSRLKPYLKKRGLQLAEDKTKVTKVTEGFDFLGFTFRKWETRKNVYNDKTRKLEPIVYLKTIVKPSKKSVQKAKDDLKEVFSTMCGSNVDSLIAKLNPILHGKANVWRHVVSKETFASFDDFVFKKVMKFIRRLHPNKPVYWRNRTYFRPDVIGQSKDRWILSSPNKHHLQLTKTSWKEIIRHELVRFTASPFDKNLEEYFEERGIKHFNANNIDSRQKLAKKQKYKCPLCGHSLVRNDEGHEVHHRQPKCKGGDDKYTNLWLVHTTCHIEHHRVFPAKGPIPTDKQIRTHRKRLANVPR